MFQAFYYRYLRVSHEEHELWKQLYCVTLDFPSDFICFLLRARLFAGGVTPCGSQNPGTAVVYFVLNISIYWFMGTLCALHAFYSVFWFRIAEQNQKVLPGNATNLSTKEWN
jgi:hypothetical protein